MNHTCRRADHSKPSESASRSTPEQTVAEVAKRPGALEVLERLGVNHCCGAHLSLREAAAAAGVPLEQLLRALESDAGAGRDRTILDVRGLEPPWPMVRVLERLGGLAEGAQLEVIHDRRPVFLYPQLDERGFAHETDEPEPGVVRILIEKRSRAAQ